jgi:MinD-like ATPase involved in chromosome partitioning or flagellar assembly
LARSSQSKEGLDGGRVQIAHVVGILAARGGFGVTSVAVNAGSSLENITEEEVIVAELRPGQGTIALELDQPAESGLTALLNLDRDNLTREQVKNELYVHNGHFSLLLASHNPHDASLLSALSHFEIILNQLKQLASYVILDLGPGLPDLTQRLINRCDQVIVIVEPVPNSVQHSAVLITDLVELGVRKDIIRVVVVNRVRSDTQMNWNQVQDKLDIEVSVAITPAPELFMEATRKKELPVDIQPESITGQQFMKLAKAIVNQSQQNE